MEQFILENGIFFIIKRLAKTEYSRNDNASERSVDIDTYYDFEIAKLLYKINKNS